MRSLSDITSTYRGSLIINSYKSWLRDGQKVLDVGCGNGVVSSQIMKYFNLDLIGCDVMNYLSRDIKFIKMTKKDKLPFQKKEFDLVMFNDVLHHIEKPDQEQLLSQSLKIGKKVLIFEVIPNFKGMLFDLILNRVHNKEMNMPFAFRSINEWKKLFKKLGAERIKVTTVKRPFFYPFSNVAFCLNGK